MYLTLDDIPEHKTDFSGVTSVGVKAPYGVDLPEVEHCGQRAQLLLYMGYTPYGNNGLMDITLNEYYVKKRVELEDGGVLAITEKGWKEAGIGLTLYHFCDKCKALRQYKTSTHWDYYGTIVVGNHWFYVVTGEPAQFPTTDVPSTRQFVNGSWVAFRYRGEKHYAQISKGVRSNNVLLKGYEERGPISKHLLTPIDERYLPQEVTDEV